MLKNIKDLTLDELILYFESLGYKKFNAKQCFKWLSVGATSFDEMTDLKKELRNKLRDDFFISNPQIVRKQVSQDKTVKYLFENADKTLIETVIMEYKHGLCACLSTQVGCNMGCKFCASSIGGKVRNLTAGEISDQIILSSKDLNKRISNVVLMGMGEPLDNYKEIVRFLKNVGNENGLNLSYRHITVSTCGLCDKINALANEGFPVTLSVSLHAANDEKRNKIMPVNRKYNIAALKESLTNYILKTKRRITIEYTLIKDFNDSLKDVRELAEFSKGLLSHVNLIQVNPVTEAGFKKSDNLKRFFEQLTKLGVNATIRRSLGSDIDAACGQLRNKEIR